MKDFLTINDIITGIFGAIFYGFGYFVPTGLGYGPVVSLIICLIAGGICEYFSRRLLDSDFFIDKPRRQVLALIGTLIIFLGFLFVADIDFHHNLFEDALDQFFWYVVIPGIGFGFSLLKRYYQKKRLLKKYGTGEQGAVIEDKRDYNPEAVNAEQKGEYEEALAVKAESGIYLGRKNNGVVEYLGITYAHAARWQAPEPVPASDKVYEAYHYGPCCLQNNVPKINPLNKHIQSEDCLTLNIVRPAKLPKNKKLPVLVNIHGGDLFYGGSASPLEDGTSFVKEQQDIIYVSFNYRLELLGFMDFSQVPGGENYAQAPYLGLLDQLEAFKWIKKNIEAFGGDAEAITACGDGAGSLCLAVLGTLDEAKGLFSRAFLFTDYNDTLLTKEQKQLETKSLLDYFAAKNMEDLLKLSSEQLQEYINVNNTAMYGLGAGLGIIPQNIAEAFAEGKAKAIDWIINIPGCETGSWNMAAGTDFTDDFFENIWKNISQSYSDAKYSAMVDFYQNSKGDSELEKLVEFAEYYFFREPTVKLAQKQLEAGGRVRLCYWDVASPVQRFGASGIGAKCTFLGNLEVGYQVGCLKNPVFSQVMQSLLANYVRCGDPSIRTNAIQNVKGINWPVCAEQGLEYLHITEKAATLEAGDIIAKCVAMSELKAMK